MKLCCTRSPFSPNRRHYSAASKPRCRAALPGGGRLDQHTRLALELYPGFSGGPLVNAQGKVVGINTRGLARGRAVTIPLVTVKRVVDEPVEKGHIANPYLGLAMQPVAVPESLRGKAPGAGNSAVLVVH